MEKSTNCNHLDVVEDFINIGTFIQHLTYYLKTTIYINKGTDKDSLLELCIKMYNKFKTIEANAIKGLDQKDEPFVRKCLKRLNLILKVTSDGFPVDIRDKNNQIQMIFLEEHASLKTNNLKSMIDYATTNNINIFPEVPLMFILRDSKYKEILWQYTRSLFYISQILISKTEESDDPNNKTIIMKRYVTSNSLENLEKILESISELEKNIELSKIMALDKFLNTKLIKTGINETNVNEARQEVKNMFSKKGLGNDNAMTKMIDSISDKLTQVDLSKGNIIQNMFGIAQNVAQEMKGDLESSPEKFQNTLGALTEVFKEAMDDSSKSGDEIPPDLKNMFHQVLSMDPSQLDSNDSELTKNLENIISTNGLDRDQFYQSIQNSNGEINIEKLQNFITSYANTK